MTYLWSIPEDSKDSVTGIQHQIFLLLILIRLLYSKMTVLPKERIYYSPPVQAATKLQRNRTAAKIRSLCYRQLKQVRILSTRVRTSLYHRCGSLCFSMFVRNSNALSFFMIPSFESIISYWHAWNWNERIPALLTYFYAIVECSPPDDVFHWRI